MRWRNHSSATAPCAAWNERRVGKPGGGGSNERDTKNPLIAANRTVTASASASGRLA